MIIYRGGYRAGYSFAGLGTAGVSFAGLGTAGVLFAGLGTAGVSFAGLGTAFAKLGTCTVGVSFAKLGTAGVSFAKLGRGVSFAGLDILRTLLGTEPKFLATLTAKKVLIIPCRTLMMVHKSIFFNYLQNINRS